jgi:osmotically-inducible protein OsmY
MMSTLLNGDSFAREADALAFEVELALRATGYPALRNLRVGVLDGVVSLSGSVPSYHMIHIATAAATCVAGVREVRIELDVASRAPRLVEGRHAVDRDICEPGTREPARPR